jgi:hypothetical protein
VRNRLSIRFLVAALASAFLIAATVITLLAAQGQGGAPAAEGGGRGGRGRGAANPSLSQQAPRLPDGTVNLGRVPGELGIWQLPYIQNMGARNIFVGAPPAAPRGERAAAAGKLVAVKARVPRVSEGERLQSPGFLFNHGLRPSTTTIHRTTQSTIPKDIAYPRAGRVCLRRPIRWKSSSSLS